MSKNGMINNFKKVTHCVFDMDGLLLDTERLYTQVTQEILDKYDKTFTMDVKVSIMGVHHHEMAQIIVKTYDLPMTWEEFSKLQIAGNRRLMPNAQLMPGAERLLRHLHANKIPMALATSSGEEMVEIKITNHKELFSLFDHRVCGSSDPEVKEGKPSPDIFLVAAARFPDQPNPSQCLVFEDAPNGVRAAKDADMQAVMVPADYVPEESRKEATQVLKSLSDFKPEDFGLPAFPK